MTRRLRIAEPVLLLCLLGVASALTLWSAQHSRYLLHDSFWINLVWGEQFYDLLTSGEVYPRWLPLSHGGLGSPVFYYYPPLAFYLMAAFAAMGVSTYGAMIATFIAAQFASGLGMYRWVKELGGKAVPAATLYVLAPFHLFDFFKRGALAEFCAFALLPLIALGIFNAARNGRPVLLAISYGALVFTHLPAAIIASLFLILPYGLWEIARNRNAALPLAVAIALGLGLAAIYLLPMVTLLDRASLGDMIATPLQQTLQWSMFNLAEWPDGVGPFIVAFFVLYLAACTFLALTARSFWSLAALCVLLLGFGVVPGLWSLPILDRIQFPWRTLMIVEFLIVTAIAATPKARPVFLLVPAAMLGLSMLIAQPVTGGSALTMHWLLSHHPDVPEYLPPGSPYKPEIYSSWALSVGEKWANAPTGATRAARFAFPTLAARCEPGGRSFVTPGPPRLLIWDAKKCKPSRLFLPAERIGLALSALSVALLCLLSWRRSRMRRGALVGDDGLRHGR